MYIKQLDWVMLLGGDLYALSPSVSSGKLAIIFEQNKYWAVWDLSLPGYDTKEEAMSVGQLQHDLYIKDFIAKYLVDFNN